MANKELEESELTREEAADRLEEIAADLRAGDSFDIVIENRTIHLSPASSIGMEIGVRESSSLLRGNRETVTVKMDWKPE